MLTLIRLCVALKNHMCAIKGVVRHEWSDIEVCGKITLVTQ